MQWETAQSHCAQLGFQLAVIRSAADQLHIEYLTNATASSASMFWIGARRVAGGIGNAFEWSDGSLVPAEAAGANGAGSSVASSAQHGYGDRLPAYANWRPNRPSAASHAACVELYAPAFQWSNARCDGPRAFICSTLPPPPAPPVSPAPPHPPPAPPSSPEIRGDLFPRLYHTPRAPPSSSSALGGGTSRAVAPLGASLGAAGFMLMFTVFTATYLYLSRHRLDAAGRRRRRRVVAATIAAASIEMRPPPIPVIAIINPGHDEGCHEIADISIELVSVGYPVEDPPEARSLSDEDAVTGVAEADAESPAAGPLGTTSVRPPSREAWPPHSV